MPVETQAALLKTYCQGCHNDTAKKGGMILEAAYVGGHWFVWLLGLIGAGCTAFYIFRAYFLAFAGESRLDPHKAEHVHEMPAVMGLPAWPRLKEDPECPPATAPTPTLPPASARPRRPWPRSS